MRQAFAVVVTLGLVAVAVFLAPPTEDPPLPPVAPVYPGSATAIGYCPTWTADDEVRSDLVIGVVNEIDASVSFQASDETLVERARRSGAGTVSALPGLAQGFVPVLAEQTVVATLSEHTIVAFAAEHEVAARAAIQKVIAGVGA